MLRISKKKLKFAKWLSCGGMIFAAVSFVIVIIFAKPFPPKPIADVFIAVALAASIVGIYGVYLLSELYKCPKCGTGVLMRGMRTYDFCYKCGTKIEIELTD